MSNLYLKNNLPKTLQIAIWQDLMDAVEEELTDNYKAEKLDFLKLVYDVRNCDSVDQLLEIANQFGYNPDLSLRGDLDFIKNEVLSIVYRIKNKSTYNVYDYIFSTILKSDDTGGIGYVYNQYWNGNRLLKAIDTEEIETNLSSFSAPEVFTGFTPFFHFNIVLTESLLHDDGYTYDLIPGINYDSGVEQIATKHLLIDYIPEELIVKNEIEYLITSEYMQFLNYHTFITKKATEVPHLGINVAAIMGTSGYFDELLPSLQQGPESYSHEAIKLRASLTPFAALTGTQIDVRYNQGFDYDNSPAAVSYDDSVILEELPNSFDVSHKFDDGLTFDVPLREPLDYENAFVTLVAGTGSKNQISKEFEGLLSEILLYFDFDFVDGATLPDNTATGNDGTIHGTFSLVDGVVTKAISFNGTDTYISTPTINTLTQDFEVFFWIKGEDNQETTDITFFAKNDFLDISYNTSTDTLTTTITGSTSNAGSFVIDLLDNEEHSIAVAISNSAQEAYVYVDKQLYNTIDISGITYTGKNTSVYIGNNGTDQFFKGIVDELKMFQKTLSDDEREYIHDYKIGGYRILDNEVFRRPLETEEVFELTDFYVVYSEIRPNTILDETYGTGNGTTVTFAHTTAKSNIKEKSLLLRWTSNSVEYEVQDDGAGSWDSQDIQGTINYDTGVISTTFENEINAEETLFEGQTSSLNTTTAFNNLSTESVKVSFIIDGTLYTIIDDGIGGFNFVPAEVLSASVVYATGQIQIEFDTPNDVDTNIAVQYDYTVDRTPDNLSNIIIDYFTTDAIEITEYGLLDNRGRLSVYVTCPPAQLKDDQHLSAEFIVSK